ncbi:hypothetical protein ABT072_48215 [Streptomyces sp. NPDC002589]|uniref:hypothetical protein n=1 Tax=Streptomyces sp. NPDC002589 TaxID=3154420 RepID=UPI00331B6378
MSADASDTPIRAGVDEEGRYLEALRRLSFIQKYVRKWLQALGSERLDTAELVLQTQQAEQSITDAFDVLAQIHHNEPLDRSVLPSHRAPTLAELITARERGDVHAEEDRFVERLSVLEAIANEGETTVWCVRAGEHRLYEARNSAGRTVWAWSAMPAAMESELVIAWNDRPGPLKVTYQPERPTRLPDQLGPTPQEIEYFPNAHTIDLDVERSIYREGDVAQSVADALAHLRDNLAHEDVQAFVDARAEYLNQHEPQLPALDVHLDRHRFAHTYSASLAWVDPATIVRTPDHEAWGTINRAEPRSGKTWIPAAIREWLDTDPAQAPQHLERCMLGDVVQLEQIPGPAGPLHTLQVDGTHRTHLWRVLALPKIFAWVENVPLPTVVNPLDIETNTVREDALRAAVWRGLLDKGIVRGTLQTPGSDLSPLCLEYVPALWLLYPPELAAAYSRRYATLYPGAWSRLGIPEDTFTSASAWVTWATDGQEAWPA